MDSLTGVHGARCCLSTDVAAADWSLDSVMQDASKLTEENVSLRAVLCMCRISDAQLHCCCCVACRRLHPPWHPARCCGNPSSLLLFSPATAAEDPLQNIFSKHRDSCQAAAQANSLPCTPCQHKARILPVQERLPAVPPGLLLLQAGFNSTAVFAAGMRE